MNTRRSYKLFLNGGRSPYIPLTSTSNSRAPTFHPPTTQNLPAPPTVRRDVANATNTLQNPNGGNAPGPKLTNSANPNGNVALPDDTTPGDGRGSSGDDATEGVDGDSGTNSGSDEGRNEGPPVPGDRQSDQTPQTQPTPAQMTTKSALSLLSRLVIFTLRCLRAHSQGSRPKKVEYADSLRRASSFRIEPIQNLESQAHHTVSGLEVKVRNARIHRHDLNSGGPVSFCLQISGEVKVKSGAVQLCTIVKQRFYEREYDSQQYMVCHVEDMAFNEEPIGEVTYTA